jgi:hypothetical protein
LQSFPDISHFVMSHVLAIDGATRPARGDGAMPVAMIGGF